MSYFNSIDWNVTKNFASVLQSYGILLGLFVGGYWTYRLYRQYRQKYPRVNLSHKIFYTKLPNNKIYLQVKVIIANVGNVLINLESGFTRITQILPLVEEIDNSRREIEWPMLYQKEITIEKKNCEIEPGESDEICFDFLINPDVELINIYSHFNNVKKKSRFLLFVKKIKIKYIIKFVEKRIRPLGWATTTIYDLREVEHV